MIIKQHLKSIIKIIRRVRWTRKIRHTAREAGEGLRVTDRSYVNRNTYLGNHVHFNGLRADS